MSIDRSRSPVSRLAIAAVLVLVTLVATPAASLAASLTPTRAALLRQGSAARAHDYTYLANETQVRRFVDRGYLVRLSGNRDYAVKHLRLPYARPEVKVFVERLGRQMRGACGDRLVVTSLVRPKNRQPRNSSPLSVHPTGMAMDLRIPATRSCRVWLEGALLNLESRGLLEAARERNPPHYHVVLFPDDYRSYLARVHGVKLASRPAAATAATHRVRPGESLWAIARAHRTSVASLQRANGLRSPTIRPGQVLRLR